MAERVGSNVTARESSFGKFARRAALAATALVGEAAIPSNQPVVLADEFTTKPVAAAKDDNRTGMKLAANLPSRQQDGVSSVALPNQERMVTTESGKVFTEPAYLKLIRDNGTRDKIFKGQDQFTVKDLEGRSILDQAAYRNYSERIKEKSEQFKDPKDFGRFVNGLRYLTGQKEYPRVLSQTQIEFMLEKFPINESVNMAGALCGMQTRGEPLAEIKAKADKLFRTIDEGGSLKNEAALIFHQFTK